MSPRNSEPMTETRTGNGDGRADADEWVAPWPEQGPEIVDLDDDEDVDDDHDDEVTDTSVPPPGPEPIPMPGPDPAPEPIPQPGPDPAPPPGPDPQPGPVPQPPGPDPVPQPGPDPAPDPSPIPPPAPQADAEAAGEAPMLSTEGRPLLTDAGVWEDRWTGIQVAFVDDPGLSIQQADRIVTEAMEELAKILLAHRETLQAQWRDGDQPPDTEQLRLTFQGYRALLFGLLST